MTDLVLRRGPLRVTVRPEAGGRIATLRHDDLGDLLVPMDNAAFDPEVWPKAGAYPLIPFHNRIRDGRFTWDGQTYQLPLHPTEPNALHGFASRKAWRGDLEADRIRLTLHYAADNAWPWALSAGQVIGLTGDALTIDLSVTNHSNSVMPAGLGWHPFFPACRVDEDAALLWPMDEQQIPFGTSEPAGGDAATRHLSRWIHADIRLDTGARMRLTASAVMRHLVVHRAPGYACIEPVSHLAGALALPLVDPADRLRPLAAGETLRGQVRLDLS